jgi:DNA-binding transcriptional ArsR family regulator
LKSRLARLASAAPMFAALGDPVRLLMIARLCSHGPLPTVQLQEGTGVSRQGVTKHLQALEDAGLVCSDRVGRDRLWRIETRRVTELRDSLDHISAEWDARIELEQVARNASARENPVNFRRSLCGVHKYAVSRRVA